jgi:hypothetical protein
MNPLKSLIVLLTVLVFAGCAATRPADDPAKQPEEALSSDVAPVRKDLIQVVCKAAYPQGCRHLGHIYPWNAWLDISGYDSAEYTVVEIQRSGGRATVYLEPLTKEP